MLCWAIYESRQGLGQNNLGAGCGQHNLGAGRGQNNLGARASGAR